MFPRCKWCGIRRGGKGLKILVSPVRSRLTPLQTPDFHLLVISRFFMLLMLHFSVLTEIKILKYERNLPCCLRRIIWQIKWYSNK